MVRLFKISGYRIMRYIAVIIILILAATQTMEAQTSQDICKQSISVLNHAVANGETFFIKVHAAENLIHHNHTDGLEAQFLELQQASPDNYIGSARVLARLNKHNAVKYQEYIDELVKLFQTSKETKVQLTALESLGKLGYNERLPAIVADADTGTHGFNGMARWILSNSGKDADEDRLSELLLSKNEIDYRYAAYALRFKSHTNAKTVERLKTCLQALKADDPARVYVASALFVHSKPAERPSVKSTLFTYLSGAVGQRYEVAEALGLGGDKTDLPVLQNLLTDENTDVKVAAANAVLHIMHYKK